MKKLLLAGGLLASTALSQSLPNVAPPPAGNPVTADKVSLGKALFWDEQLSTSGMTACGTCHILEDGGSDPRTLQNPGASTHPGVDELFGTDDDILGSRGVIRSDSLGSYTPSALFGLQPQVTRRRAPSVINSGFPPLLFWDGRAAATFEDPSTGQILLHNRAALESQVVEPPMNAVEMGHAGIQWSDLTNRIPSMRPLAWAWQIPTPLASFIAGRTYGDLFQIVFGPGGVTPARIAMAIATYERTLVSNQPIQSTRQLTPLEARGGSFFDSATKCGRCHPGPRFTDDLFHNINVTPIAHDPGRGAITDKAADLGKFKTPSLLNVELRAPYFHDGSASSLDEVVDHYDIGPGMTVFASPLNLTQLDRSALVAYMRTFTDLRVAAATPPFDRPLLFRESPRTPVLFGIATPSGPVFPEAIAVEPPALSNPGFTLGLRNATGGGFGILVLGPDALLPGVPMLGITAHVDPQTALFTAPFLLGDPGTGSGFASENFDLTPVAPGAIGTTWFSQWVVVGGSQMPPALSASEGIEFTIF